MVLMVGCAGQEPASSGVPHDGTCQLAYVPTCESAAAHLGSKLLGRLRLPVFHCDAADRLLDASTLFESNETLAPLEF